MFNSSISIGGNSGLIIAKDDYSFNQRFGVDTDYKWNATWGNDQINNATVVDLLVISCVVNLTNTSEF